MIKSHLPSTTSLHLSATASKSSLMLMVTRINAVFMNELDDLAGDDDEKRNKAWIKLLAESGSIMLAGVPLAR